MSTLKGNKLLRMTLPTESKQDILEKIKKYIEQPTDFIHIVSLNPENLVIAQENKEFKKVLKTAKIKIIDGVGIVLSARLLGMQLVNRLTGVELVQELIERAGRMRLRVLLIGGRQNLALRLAGCYQKKYAKAKFLGTIGFMDIKHPQKTEEEKIFSIVRHYKPHIILAAFGSPAQELWFYHNKEYFNGIICMGVGGAFDYFIGLVPRPPSFIKRVGLEWLFRLVFQPWRLKRQLRLIKFIWLVLKEKYGKRNLQGD